jgi:hypothetical protein
VHAGSLSYATGFGPTHVIVKIDPADVVSIPTDCSCQKLRTCAYEVVALCQGKMEDGGVRDASNPYASPYRQSPLGVLIKEIAVQLAVAEEDEANYESYAPEEEELRQAAYSRGVEDRCRKALPLVDHEEIDQYLHEQYGRDALECVSYCPVEMYDAYLSGYRGDAK